MVMDVPTEVKSNLDPTACDFWDVHYSQYYFD